MRRITLIAIIVVSSVSLCYGLETFTHEELNEYIVRNTFNGFSLNTYLKDQLGLRRGVEEEVNANEIWWWLRKGGLYEDVPYWWMLYLRSVNHFHNPLTDQGFSGIWGTGNLSGVSSIQWSQWPLGAQTVQVLGSGNYSWNDARDYFYKALTAINKTTRDKNFADTFRGLGQLTHLVEDLSVPEHTRDDEHYIFYNYEKWAKKNVTRDKLPAYPPIYFDRSAIGNPNPLASVPVANLFDTNQYNGSNPNITLQNNIGLSEYTNANFLSPDSMFTSNFPYPNWGSVVEYEQTVSGKKRIYIRKLGQGETESGKVGNGEHIEHLATGRWGYKLLPSLLKQNGIYLRMDEECYKDYASKLIPRAVGYSAGLLNYFFRGTLEITAPDSFVYSITDGSQTPQQFTAIKAKLRNTTPNEEMQGGIIQAVARYKVIPNYVGDLSNYPPDGTTMHNIPYSYSVSAPLTITSLSSTISEEFTFDFTGSPIPAGITDLYLHVVFKGTLGNEQDIAVAAGMKDLMEPTHHVFWNLTDMFSLYIPADNSYHLYTAEQIRNDPYLLSLAAGAYIDPHDINFEFGYMAESPPVNPVTTLATVVLHAGRHVRLINLVDRQDSNYVRVTWSSIPYPDEKYGDLPFHAAQNEEIDGIWHFTPVSPFRTVNGHLNQGIIACTFYIDGCPYPEEEAIPVADMTPYPLASISFPEGIITANTFGYRQVLQVQTRVETGIRQGEGLMFIKK